MATIKGINVGTSRITASYGGKTSYVDVTVSAFTLSNSNVTFNTISNVPYDGNAHKIHPTYNSANAVRATVYGETKTLTEGTDYTIAWSSSSDGTSCIAVGTVTITITGKGNYTGTATKTYQITAPSFTVTTSGQSSVINQSYTYNGAAQGVGLVASGLSGGQTATIKYGTTSGTYNLTSAPTQTTVNSSSPKTVYWQATAPNHQTQSGSYTITITARAITFTADNQSKEYDGTALSATNTATRTAGNTLVTGHTATFSCTGSQTVVGSSAKTLSSVTIKDGSNNDVTSNYSITKNPGTLTVSSTTFTVSEPDQSYVYNGAAQGAAITVSNIKGGQTATIKYGTTSGTYNLTSAPTQTTVNSSSPKTVYWQVTVPNHDSQTGSYTLTITARSITFKADNQSKEYDGTALSATNTATRTAGNTLVTGHTATFSCTGSQTVVGSSAKTLSSVTIKDGSNNDVTSNYSITKNPGTLTVSSTTFTVSEPDQSYVYNGAAQGAAITVSNIKGGQTATIKYGTSAGSYTTTTVPTQTDANPSSPKTVYWQVTVPNHTTQTGSYTITVNKKTPAFELQGETQTYHTTAYIKGRAETAGTIYWGTTDSTMTQQTAVSTPSVTTYNTTITSQTNVDTKTIYAYFVPTDTSNFNGVGSASSYAKSAAAKVNASNDNDISVTISGTLSYTGSAQVIATKDTNSGEGCAHFTLGYSTTSGGTVTWGTEDAATLSVTGPGTYYIHYKITPDANHNHTETDKQLTGTVTIGNGTLTITITGYSGTYNGSAHNIVGSGPTAKNQADQTVTGVTYTYSTAQNGTYSASLTRTDATGTASNENATVTYWVKAEKAGYDTVTKSFDVYIARANNPLTISPTTMTLYSKTANGSGNPSGYTYHTGTITPSGAQGSVSYTSSATSKATVTNAGVVSYAGAGSATITVTAAGNSNYKSGSKTCAVTTILDTVKTYGNISGTPVISQNTLLPAGGVNPLSTSNIGTYCSYTTPCTQDIEWNSGYHTNGTITYAWSGSNVTIPSLGTTPTSTNTSRTVSFKVVATGEGTNKTAESAIKTSLNQEPNTVTGLTLTVGGSTNSKTIIFGSSHDAVVSATFKSGETDSNFTLASITSSDTDVATVS